jgi:hypothetical protein
LVWEVVHYLSGRIAIVLGIITCLIGLQLIFELSEVDRASWFTGYAVGFTALTLVVDGLLRLTMRSVRVLTPKATTESTVTLTDLNRMDDSSLSRNLSFDA